jgi:dolichol-phosphate mannosyltransferase
MQKAAQLYCIIPAYRAGETIAAVVSGALNYVDAVVVVDDACPEHSGEIARRHFGETGRVHVIVREKNGGVGAAMKTGLAYAIERGADVAVKIDADGQMDVTFIPLIQEAFAGDPSLVCVKGNRFFDAGVLSLMPKRRLFGNAVLSLLVKCSSGYWNIIDPTNGYVALNLNVLKYLPWQSFANSYFFEISLLCELGLRRLPIREIAMPTIYTSAPSSLSIGRVVLEFPPKMLSLFLRRIGIQYFTVDINLGTLYLIAGALLLLFGVIFGSYEWITSIATQIPRATGTVMLAVVPIMMGFQLLLNALMHDVAFSKRTVPELVAVRRPIETRAHR